MNWRILRIALLIGTILLLYASATRQWPAKPVSDLAEKIGAVHFFRSYDQVAFNPKSLLENHIDEVVLVPYAYQEGHLNAQLRIDGRRRRARRDSLFLLRAQDIQSHGLSVTFKPHIWMRTTDGKWRSDIDFTSDSIGQAWGEAYRTFILRYAKISEEIGAPLFCIGTELTLLSQQHPSYWRSLIADVRSVYSGKLFYAANWYEELEAISFWDDLDLIGVQAYYPLTDKEEPAIDDLLRAWAPIKQKLRRMSKKWQRPILFSELGYRSTACAAIHPWEWVDHQQEGTFSLSLQTQATCYEAAFQAFWHEPWFAGVMAWQWRENHAAAGGLTNLDFTPQNKPAQQVLAKYFNTESKGK